MLACEMLVPDKFVILCAVPTKMLTVPMLSLKVTDEFDDSMFVVFKSREGLDKLVAMQNEGRQHFSQHECKNNHCRVLSS